MAGQEDTNVEQENIDTGQQPEGQDRPPDRRDAAGNPLGFPRDTAITDMTEAEQAAYWRHQSRRHENRLKGVLGGRSAEEVRADLTELEQLRSTRPDGAGGTPDSGQLAGRLAAAEQRGREAAAADAAEKAARVVLTATLTSQGHPVEDATDVAEAVNTTRFVTDGEVDVPRLLSFAARFAPKPQRDYGAGPRGGTPRTEWGAAGKAEAARRYGTTA